MSDNIMEAGSSTDGNRCIIERSITMPGLNLLIVPDAANAKVTDDYKEFIDEFLERVGV